MTEDLLKEAMLSIPTNFYENSKTKNRKMA